jgi:CRP/FNR family transcriptional regulator
MTPTRDIFKYISFFTEPALQNEILEQCQIRLFEKDDVIVSEGQFVKILPIVISGGLRVYQTKEDREILLYYVETSQTCMMSLSACFFDNKSPSQAVATEKTQVLAVPTRLVMKWQREYSSWNNYVIKTFRNRYDELLDVFESVAFDHIDKRVLKYLQSRVSKESNNSKAIKISHQELSRELGTTRVVISRILKQFEMDNVVQLQRGYIKIL